MKQHFVLSKSSYSIMIVCHAADIFCGIISKIQVNKDINSCVHDSQHDNLFNL